MRIAIQCWGIVMNEAGLHRGMGRKQRQRKSNGRWNTVSTPPTIEEAKRLKEPTRMWCEEMHKHTLPTRPHLAFQACAITGGQNRPSTKSCQTQTDHVIKKWLWWEMANKTSHANILLFHGCPWSKATTKLLEDKQSHTSSQFHR